MLRRVVTSLATLIAVGGMAAAEVGYIDWMDPMWEEKAKLGRAETAVIAIDTSGSITPVKLRKEIKKAEGIVDRLLRDNMHVPLQVFTFNSDIDVIWPVGGGTCPLSPGNIDEVKAAINGIVATNNLTWLTGAIDHACSITDPADPKGEKKGPDTGTLFLLTDGRPTTATRNGPYDIVDADTTARARAENFKVNCSTFAILGIDVNLAAEAFLRDIATEGAYLYLCTSQIAFSMYQDGASDIYTVNWDGSELTNITNTPDVDEFWPEWSPEGARIAFVGCEESICRPNHEPTDIWIMNADGSNRADVTGELTERLEWSPVWSPDGDSILFTGSRFLFGAEHGYLYGLGRCGELYLADVPSGAIIQMTEGEYPAEEGEDVELLECFTSATWNPSGERFAFLRSARPWIDYFGYIAPLCVMSPDDATYEQWLDLFDVAGEYLVSADLCWCDDGLHVAFLTYDDASWPYQPDLCTLLVVEGDVVEFSRCAIPGYSSTHTSLDAVAWSPSGDRVALRAVGDPEEGEVAVYVATLEGMEVIDFTNVSDRLDASLLHCDLPAWSPDGRKLAFGITAAPDDEHYYEWSGLAVVSADGGTQGIAVSTEDESYIGWYDWQSMGSLGD